MKRIKKDQDTDGQHIFMDDQLATSLEKEFNRIATEGAVGDPHGIPAYGYLRVSSRGQAEEGRSGLPRQLEHIAEKASQEGLCIPWDMIYCDDHTGFTFEDRPGLQKLMEQVKESPAASQLVIEYPDRMSRDHTWRYGYLREQFQRLDVEYVYWRGYQSEIERTVLGTISEQGMRAELERMHFGTVAKARSGRITARVPAYGYKFVDSSGRDRSHPDSKWLTDTHYAILQEEAEVMQFIYRSLAFEGATLGSLVNDLNNRGVAPPKSCKFWEQTLLSKMVRNPVYKGEFAANHWYQKKVWSERSRRMVTRRFERPKEEWITVPVPAIVTAGTWKLAIDTLGRNKSVSMRNTRYDYLLVNLLVCAECGYSFTTHTRKIKRGKPYFGATYHCVSRKHRIKPIRESVGCTQSQISARVLDAVVWKALMDLLTTPDLLAEAIDEFYAESGVDATQAQIEFIDGEIKQREVEEEKLYRAYLKDAYDDQEYADRRREIKAAVEKLRVEKQALEMTILSQEEFARRRQSAVEVVEQMRAELCTLDLPFETKRRIVRLIVDRVVLNVNEGWFKIEGVLKGKFSIQSGEFVNILVGRGSCSRSA